ncbi:MAG: DUF721 domain-containing protein [Cyclobacteriaceae bacterium]|nr:DUF721 domain-containing protein [Cyclobacteriaceae bacterium]
MNEDHTHSFKDAFSKFLKEEKLEQVYHEKRLISLWADIMGPAISRRTTRVYIKEKILYVTLNSAPLKQELTHSRQKVLSLIEDRLGAKVVEDVRFL